MVGFPKPNEILFLLIWFGFSFGDNEGFFYNVCAALSDYTFTAIACNVAFLGDHPDYFDIVLRTGNVARANQGSMADDHFYNGSQLFVNPFKQTVEII